jgi:phosphotransferase system enzyme I (PtsI)
MSDEDSRDTAVLDGIGVTPVSGVGSIVRYDPEATLSLPAPPDASSVDPEAERRRFRSIRESVREELTTERESVADRVGTAEAEIFSAHIQFLDDPQIEDRVDGAIANGLPAPHAVDRAFDDAIEQFAAAGGVAAERTDDLREVRDRLLRLLLDVAAADLSTLPAGSVLVANRLGPTDTAQLDPDVVAGFVTATGGRTSHAAIVARSLGLPAVVGVDAIDSLPDGETVLVDGDAGEVILDPDHDRVAAVTESGAGGVEPDPVTTADGRSVEVAANIGTPEAGRRARELGADGVGLFRTEFLFLDRETPPSEREQYEAFVDVLETFEGGRVVVRTLDVGGDKPVPYLDRTAGDNPFLGVRGVRLAPSERADLFDTQLRALLRAAATDHGDGLAVMVPLVTTTGEVAEVRDRIETIAATLETEGIDYRVPELGVMIETPASVFLASELAERVDFLSIGTNDLTQYVMAAARDDERLQDLHDPLHPPVLRAIDRTVRAAAKGDAWVGMCGEMAGNPAFTELLVGLGLDELSLSAVTVPEVKTAVTETTAEESSRLADQALAATTKAEVEELLERRGDAS